MSSFVEVDQLLTVDLTGSCDLSSSVYSFAEILLLDDVTRYSRAVPMMFIEIV